MPQPPTTLQKAYAQILNPLNRKRCWPRTTSSREPRNEVVDGPVQWADEGGFGVVEADEVGEAELVDVHLGLLKTIEPGFTPKPGSSGHTENF